jgi:membrane protease YdiL (CAAX protease family)
VKAIGALLGGILLTWVACWLPLGLWAGDATLLLHPVSAPMGLRQLYLVMLYTGLLGTLGFCWKTFPPPLRWSSPHLLKLLGVAWLALGLERLLLWPWWKPAWPSTAAWLSALLVAPLVALIEEAVFRGYLYGHLKARWGLPRAALGLSLFFALVHLFRPGDALFKLFYGLGLTLAALVLVLARERTGLLGATLLHSSWISAAILDPPGQVVPGWWSGLRGEPAAGMCSWLFLLGLALWLYRQDPPPAVISSTSSSPA